MFDVADVVGLAICNLHTSSVNFVQWNYIAQLIPPRARARCLSQ